MSSLREKLLRHKKAERAPLPEVHDGDPTEIGAEAGQSAVHEPVTAAPNEWQAVGGWMETTEWGSFVLRRRTYAAGFRHGKYQLSDLQREAMHLRSLYSPGGGRQETEASLGSDRIDVDGFHERLLFIDTETTGLGLGTGNIPFMVGIGFYQGGDYTVEQMLIRHPGEEIAMLAYLQEKLERHPVVISYNGKSFDWPIVKNRYIMNRMTLQAEPEGHIDFLYPSRSLWKHTLSSCRLGNVEEERLMVHREDDVPGSLAPALYFQYLAEKEPSVLHGVFVHNELDILSLAGLAVHFAGVLSGRIDWRDVRPYGYEEWFRMGLWLDKVGMREAAEGAMDALNEALLYGEEDDEAADCFGDRDRPGRVDTLSDVNGDSVVAGMPYSADAEGIGGAALASGLDAETAEGSAFWLPLAQYFKRLGRYAEACRLWQRYIERKGELSIASLEPYIELSMHYEHREKQWETALKYAIVALDKLWQREALKSSGKGKPGASRGRAGETTARGGAKETDAGKEADALRKRIERLKRKAASGGSSRKAEPPPPLARSSSSRREKMKAEQLALPLEQSV
ncbi:ribonuclease H-like domain-containing protein [Paenibacillus allorhizosphaerae]|uniref:YprB ribonuclease H-like domain-containing protein n=1 Tax=Paenibacillus allorhizosphaerae TaxID=2849866 RepID=A0ABM8VL74_9BACL|nr:ribonuclease H-like domain-containing protein [Paenibacillus allorhizosphaerae]CAG7648222.1 hypothetical protein PAECIP111802_04155 [Paenibacillus allorhizosphaerae]